MTLRPDPRAGSSSAVRRAALIYNPAAGLSKRASLLSDLEGILTGGGVEVETVPTTGPASATEIARDIAARGSADTVLALGGDGTLRELAKGLLGSPVALAPLSGGTTNVVSRALGLPGEPRKTVQVLLDAVPTACDVGLCGDEPFLIGATLGIDAATMARASTKLKNLVGRAAVAISWFETAIAYDYPEIEFVADGAAGSATFVAACNIAYYGGQFKLAPEASFTSRNLHLVTFVGDGGVNAARFLTNLLLGRHLEMTTVEHRPLANLTLTAPLSAPLQLDGDVIEIDAPVEIRLAQERVVLLAAPADAS